MSVNLSKGAKVNLSKKSEGLSKIKVGLGWDPVGAVVTPKEKKGLLSRLKSALVGDSVSEYSGQDIDCDAWVCLLRGGKLKSDRDLIWYSNKSYIDNGEKIVNHHGDNLTGDGDGDDEVISINLEKLPSDVDSIIVGVTIFCGPSRNQDFSKIQNTFIRVVDERDNTEIAKFMQKEMCGSKQDVTFIAGKLYKEQNEWSFEAMGTLTSDSTILDAVSYYR